MFLRDIDKVIQNIFSALRDAIFIASYLGTHQLILGGLWNLYGAGICFQTFLNKLMQRERDFGGSKYFSKSSYPLPPESQLDPPINTVFAPSLINRLTHPHQNKRHSGLRLKMRPNQDVRGDTKECTSGYAMATPLAYARVDPEP